MRWNFVWWRVRRHAAWGAALAVALAGVSQAEAAGDEHGALAINKNSVARSHWQIGVFGNGPRLDIAGGGVVITIPAASTPGVEGFINVGLGSLCVLRGDFDVQVEYSLIEWPPLNGVQVLLGDAPPVNSHSIARGQFPTEGYLSFYAPDSVAVAESSDMSSALRLVRSGDSMTTYFLSQGAWIPMLSGPTQTGDTPFQIIALSFSPVLSEVKVKFSDFEVNRGQVVCPA